MWKLFVFLYGLNIFRLLYKTLRTSVQQIKANKLRGLSPQANYTDRATAAVGEVVPIFAGRRCYVFSATDVRGR
jgi:hypothetical protein